ncbi:MAG: hypothetical protein AAFZ07_28970, partial [Actinomycetota bacterium]
PGPRQRPAERLGQEVEVAVARHVHDAVDASKVALVGLVEHLRAAGAQLLDVQWTTPHLARLGVIDVPRDRYLDLLAEALGRPLARPWPVGAVLLDAE